MAKHQVPAARHTMEILSLLSSIDVPISASRIQNELGLPRSTTYHLLAEMVDAGFVVHLPEHRTYGLGLAAYAMASAYATQQPLVRLATKDLEAIAAVVSGTGHLSRMAGSEVLYLQEVRSPGAVSLVTQRGVRLQAQNTASGRCMLAQLSEQEARAVCTVNGIGSQWPQLRQRLEVVAQRGWDSEDGEVSPGLASVSVAVLDHVGRPAAALTVTYQKSRVTEAAQNQALEMLHALAQKISKKMYGAGNAPA